MPAISKFDTVKDEFAEMVKREASIEELENKFDVKYKTLLDWWVKLHRDIDRSVPPLPEDNRGKKKGNKVKVSKNRGISLNSNFLDKLEIPAKSGDVFIVKYKVEDGYDVIKLKHPRPVTS